MKLRNYCIVVMGETDGVIDEIQTVSDSQPNYLNGGGLLISTFSSFGTPPELTDFFKSKKRNFLIFDLNGEHSGYNITKPDIQDGLFGFLKTMTPAGMRQRTQELIQELTSSTVANGTHHVPIKRKAPKTKISLSDIKDMDKNDREELLNKLIEKGHKKLSAYDKKMIDKLAKSLG